MPDILSKPRLKYHTQHIVSYNIYVNIEFKEETPTENQFSLNVTNSNFYLIIVISPNKERNVSKTRHILDNITIMKTPLRLQSHSDTTGIDKVKLHIHISNTLFRNKKYG